MKKIPLLTAALAAFSLAAPTAVFAAKADGPKAKLLAKYDTNKNGVLDADEIAALRKDFAAAPTGDLKRLDADHDGKLSDEEIAALSATAKKKGEKKAGGKKKADTAAPAAAPEAAK